MTRYDILFGQNYTDLSFDGLGDKAQLKCDISLGTQPLDTLVSEHDGTTYWLYDVQDIVPIGNTIGLPLFRNGFTVYSDFVQELSLKYYNASKSQTIKRKMIAGAAIEGFHWTGVFGQFLTKQPPVQKTNFRATEWLWYYMNYNENINEVMLKIEVKTKGNQTLTASMTIPDYIQNQLICVDVSPEFVATKFASIEKKYIDSYSVWFEKNDTRLSEIREYHLSNSSAYDVELIVRNSFGVWDTINMTAGQKNSKEFDLQYSETRRKTKLESARWVNKYSFAISDLERGWLQYMIEVITSRKIYLRDGSELVPIVCTTKSFDDVYNTKIQDEITLEFRAESIERSVKI